MADRVKGARPAVAAGALGRRAGVNIVPGGDAVDDPVAVKKQLMTMTYDGMWRFRFDDTKTSLA